MDRDLKERFERLFNQLQDKEWTDRFSNRRVRDEVSWWLRQLERWLDNGTHWPLSEDIGCSPWHNLHRLEAKVDELLRRPVRCNMPSEVGQQLPNFMTSLTAINDGNLAVARTKFRAHQSAWLVDAERCVIADPYIFHPGSEVAADYAAGIAEIVGGAARRVDFYFSALPDRYRAPVAALVHAALQANYQGSSGTRQFTFYDCRDMHDRVWLRHTSIANDPPYVGWKARVVGASVNGVRKRPTYVVDMDDNDANDYAKYLKNIRDSLSASGITLVPPP
ncbi:hypothetical protein [Paracidovorax oryzae]|uniref:hypothetical protein n=1 Tax=Paracidovorax oryzae TaxID=862720 RepID=UPI0012EB881B|nr:hypothetical protein [Paracidovorax oryzae]